MSVTDPRERYDDLLTSRDERTVDRATFAEFADTEAVQSGWVAVGVVIDDGRVLLVRDTDDTWSAPGGTRQPGETLGECVRREVREETGVRVEPDRPHAVTDVIRRHDGRERSFAVVTFAARPTRVPAALPDPTDLAAADENIVGLRWVEELPDQMMGREPLRRIWSQHHDAGRRASEDGQ